MSDVSIALEHKDEGQDKIELNEDSIGNVDEDDEETSTSSIASELDENEMGNIFGDHVSNFSENINPRQNPLLWVQTQIARCVDPKVILRELVPGVNLPDSVSEISVWRLIFEIITEPSPRQQLVHVCSIESVVRLIRECRNIIVLTGAGVSVSCGIPDFRSRDGIYSRLSKDFPDLPDPQSMFDINFFHSNPYPFYRFAKEIYPGRFEPSLSHRFIQHLEASGRLLRNYTQNIDTLEQVAGINNVVHCHGSFATASCMNCKLKVKADDIKADVFAQRIPYCKSCTSDIHEGRLNILKPDIVFFGEGLPDEFHRKIKSDKEKADLLIVIGSSLKVRPVALIPSFLRPDIPQILINREQLPHLQFDVELYGNCDDVIRELCCQLGKDWDHVTESYIPHPLDCEKYKYLFDNTSMQRDSAMTGKELRSSEEGRKCKCNVSKSFQPGPCECSIVDDDSGNSVKRKYLENEESSERKHQKVSKETIDSDVYYLFYPPNSYIFHGAEMDCSDDSEEDTCDIDNEHDSVGEENKNNLISSHITPVVGEALCNEDMPVGQINSLSGLENKSLTSHGDSTRRSVSDNEVSNPLSIDKDSVSSADTYVYETGRFP